MASLFAFISKLEEVFFLARSVVLVAVRMLWDWMTCPKHWPTTIQHLDVPVLSSLTGMNVTHVEHDARFLNRDVTEVGAGGIGTSRAWLTLTVQNENGSTSKEHVFVKLPTESVLERVFLTVFGVYHNELNFYNSIANQPQFAPGLFPRVYFAQMHGFTSFVLILENVAYRSKQVEFPPILAEYPLPRAKLVVRTLATLHAANWNAPPKGVWTDKFSAPLTQPPGRPHDATRPRFLNVIATNTLKQVQKRYGMPEGVLKLYVKFINNEQRVRKYWSRKPLTMVWGDGHLGNMYFVSPDESNPTETMGFYDAQCVAAEHGMRDFCYHLVSGYDAQKLQEEEVTLVHLYCDSLNQLIEPKGHEPLTFEAAWFQYRLHVVWAIAAFVISAGASDLMKADVARPVLERIYKAAQRLDTAGALADVLSNRAP
eukprot:m.157751 g.157751  ORF g.157751 m.157751 type:complete len:427 (+) comp17975_c1_seq9:163-1443(+)